MYLWVSFAIHIACECHQICVLIILSPEHTTAHWSWLLYVVVSIMTMAAQHSLMWPNTIYPIHTRFNHFDFFWWKLCDLCVCDCALYIELIYFICFACPTFWYSTLYFWSEKGLNQKKYDELINKIKIDLFLIIYLIYTLQCAAIRKLSRNKFK